MNHLKKVEFALSCVADHRSGKKQTFVFSTILAHLKKKKNLTINQLMYI
jgi:hypothetical protein